MRVFALLAILGFGFSVHAQSAPDCGALSENEIIAAVEKLSAGQSDSLLSINLTNMAQECVKQAESLDEQAAVTKNSKKSMEIFMKAVKARNNASALLGSGHHSKLR